MSSIPDTTATADASASPLLPAQRRQRIVDFLRVHGAVTIGQLEQALGASLSTLRRDLDTLAAEGVVDRTHGGALLRQQAPEYATFEPEPEAAAELSPREKAAIGQAAAEALLPRQSVIFDSGTTVLEAARAAVRRQIPLTAVTNDLVIAQVLGKSPLVQVHMLGGMLRPGSTTVIGQTLIDQAGALRADVLLMGAHAVTENVISETSAELAAVKRALMKAANSTRLLVDSSKFRPRAFMRIAALDEVGELVTDSGLSAAEEERLRALDLKLTVVKVQP
ncbi:DeoR/GlpR family DNA-binding transcription regulator [Azohydromonas caseinilytica]|uniref:DeoR/GlpR transcriptional regulator n=1 Tax=Azohydromonas caseinilytica TaxID=2728836 RepID=A0A848FBJ8_9BURK|nr:DeoR/GlpR family DNA-binding transcription regulator [Azohydromonas caseinilytica]NML15693.1 DeoR/GlpR transcriptional regulator [Azohydromonas caseinilytica]